MTMNTAFSSRNLLFPTRVVTDWLMFDEVEEAEDFCHHYRLDVKDGKVAFSKSCSLQDYKLVREILMLWYFVEGALKMSFYIISFVSFFCLILETFLNGKGYNIYWDVRQFYKNFVHYLCDWYICDLSKEYLPNAFTELL